MLWEPFTEHPSSAQKIERNSKNVLVEQELN